MNFYFISQVASRFRKITKGFEKNNTEQLIVKKKELKRNLKYFRLYIQFYFGLKILYVYVGIVVLFDMA